jgi:hypothetical protein
LPRRLENRDTVCFEACTRSLHSGTACSARTPRLETGEIVRHETFLTGESVNRMKEHWRVASFTVESGQVFERYESLTERQLQVCDGRVDNIQHAVACDVFRLSCLSRWLVGDWTEAGKQDPRHQSISASRCVLLTGYRDLRSVQYSHDHEKQLPFAPS